MGQGIAAAGLEDGSVDCEWGGSCRGSSMAAEVVKGLLKSTGLGKWVERCERDERDARDEAGCLRRRFRATLKGHEGR